MDLIRIARACKTYTLFKIQVRELIKDFVKRGWSFDHLFQALRKYALYNNKYSANSRERITKDFQTCSKTLKKDFQMWFKCEKFRF